MRRQVRRVRARPDGAVPLTIGQFYDADPRRRLPGEMKLGQCWSTAAEPGCDYAVFWVAATGELVAMRAPSGRPIVMGPTGVAAIPHYGEADFTVDVLGILNPSQLEAATSGWRVAMSMADSLSWLRIQIERTAPDG